MLALHRDWVEEFDRLRKLRVKFNYRNLQSLSKHLLENSCSDEYNSLMLDSRTQRQLQTFITARFTHWFADRFGIVSRALTGKHKFSPAKIERLEKQVAYHLGVMARGFRSGELNEDCIENVDETHFVIDVDNGRTLGFSGKSEVKYADAVSGGEGMTMVVCLSVGMEAKIQPPFMVFKNGNRSFRIRGVPDNVSGVSYRSGQERWMGTKVMPEWLTEKKVICALSNRNKRILYADNCSGHKTTPEMLAAAQNISTKIGDFEPNLTDYVQPCDSFIIENIKSEWSVEWEKYKMQMNMDKKWAVGLGKIPNPGRTFFLNLAVEAVNAVNRKRDSDAVSYARKAMILTGVALNLNGQWKERQLLPKLQHNCTNIVLILMGKRLKLTKI